MSTREPSLSDEASPWQRGSHVKQGPPSATKAEAATRPQTPRLCPTVSSGNFLFSCAVDSETAVACCRGDPTEAAPPSDEEDEEWGGGGSLGLP